MAAMSVPTSILTTTPTPTDKPAYPFPSIPDVPEIADRNCKLLGPFAISVQLVMGFVVLGMLVLKRQKEKPKRPWKIWTLDISKQMLGQLFVHTLNVLLSSLGSIASEGANNPCSLYFLNIAVDTTIGVLFIYFSMRFLTHYFTDVLGWPGFVSGQYTSIPTVIGRRRRRRTTTNDVSYDESVLSPSVSETNFDSRPQNTMASIHETLASAESQTLPAASASPTAPPSKKQRPRLSFFFRQLSLYLFSLLLMKTMVVIIFAIFPFLFKVGRWVLNIFGVHQKAQIFFVMAAFPLAMNTLQFWLIDSLLRHNPLTSIYRNDEEAEAAGTSGSNGGGAEQGQARQSWWVRDPISHPRDDSQTRLMSDLDHDDSSRDEEHAYPPTPSATSSVAQLDAQIKSSTIESVLDQTQPSSASEHIDDKAAEGLSALDASKYTSDAVATPDDEEEDAWDNWDEDSKPTEQARRKT